MALETKCQTPGAKFHTHIESARITVRVDLGMLLNFGPAGEEAELLEANIHNALEIVLAKYYK